MPASPRPSPISIAFSNFHILTLRSFISFCTLFNMSLFSHLPFATKKVHFRSQKSKIDRISLGFPPKMSFISFFAHLSQKGFLVNIYRLPAIIFEDNGAVVALSREMTSRAKRCKHFLMAIRWIREQVEAGLILLQQIPDVENRADILTKIITGIEFRRKAEDLLGSKIDTAMEVDETVSDD